MSLLREAPAHGHTLAAAIPAAAGHVGQVAAGLRVSSLMVPPLWGVIAGVTALAGYIPYLRDAWRRASDPDPAAWLLWMINYAILLGAQAAQHPQWTALSLAALQLVGTVLVFAVLAGQRGWRFGAGRWAVVGCAAVAMCLWWITRAPAPAMCLALATEGVGMALVMINAYRRPGSETLVTWWIFTVAGVLDLPALSQHAPRLLYAYPVFFSVMGTGYGWLPLFTHRSPCVTEGSHMSMNGPEFPVSPVWRKSSYSQVGECVKVANLSRGLVAVRDSKDPAAPVLTYTAAQWRSFLSAARAGRYDRFC